MRRRLAGVILGMVVAASVLVTPTAGAVDAPPWPLNCAEGMPARPTPGTVYIDSEGAHVNLDALPGDADAVSQYAVDLGLHWATCITSRVPTEYVFCTADIVANVGSYVSVNGTQIDVYYPALIRAVQDCTFST